MSTGADAVRGGVRLAKLIKLEVGYPSPARLVDVT